jgi:hypothetical protein
MGDLHKRQDLQRIIVAQPEHEEGRALVKVSEFFDGNDDLGSIGCNLPEHPGLDTFRRVIEEMLALPSVDQVWLQIYDIDEGDWPFSENALIFGAVATADIEKLASAIEPSEVQEMHMDWAPSRDPSLEGRRYVNLWWD